MIIHYFTTASHLPQYIQPYFSKFGYALKAMEQLNGNFEQIDVVLLFGPLQMANTFITSEQLWKNYLAFHYPDIVFITAAFTNTKQHNYLDLMELPEDFAVFLKNCKKVSDKWTPVDTQALNMAEKILRFYEGHGDESVIDELNKIRRTLLNVQQDVEDGMGFEQIEREYPFQERTTTKWQNLYSRWLNYYPLFESLPFFYIFREVNDLVHYVLPFFQSNCKEEQLFQQLNCVENLNLIKQKLQTAKQYV